MPSDKKKATRAWEKRNPEKLKAQRDRYYQKYKTRLDEKAKAWSKANPEKVLRAQLRRQYGITLEHFEEMLIHQSGRCAICGKPMTGHKEPCVDHDHETGEIRELLCSNCNKVLGFMEDKPGLLEEAADYLMRHKEIKIANHGVRDTAALK